jgi:NADH-quinone oxidoreductase subunit M
MLWLVQRLFYGPESSLTSSTPPDDLRFGEAAVLWPLVVLMLVMGVAPNYWLDRIENRNQAGISHWVSSAASASTTPSPSEANQ